MSTLASNKRRLKCSVCDRTAERKSRQQNLLFDALPNGPKTPFAIKTPVRDRLYRKVTGPHKSVSENNVLQWPKTGSSLSANGPINLLGGGNWKWPGAGSLDGPTLAKIRWSEVGGELAEPPK